MRGIDRERIVRWTWVIAGVLTGAAGVLAGLDRAIDPLLGWNYVVTVFAAAILGGLGNPLGAVLGALTLGVVEETSTLVIPPNYRQVVSFAAIAFLLLLRPQGLARHREGEEMTAYLVTILILVCIAMILGLALNLQWGLCGMVNFGMAGFFALGAYSAALVALAGAGTLVGDAGRRARVRPCLGRHRAHLACACPTSTSPS